MFEAQGFAAKKGEAVGKAGAQKLTAVAGWSTFPGKNKNEKTQM